MKGEQKRGSWWEQQALGVGGLVSLGASGHQWGAGGCLMGHGQDLGFYPEWVGGPAGPNRGLPLVPLRGGGAAG